MDTGDDNSLTYSMDHTSKAFYVIVAILAGVIAIFTLAWFIQFRDGLGVTGMYDIGTGGGTPWGIYISTFVWWVGIAHGGIAVSAAIRLFKLEMYKPIARLAEVITPITLGMAGLIITLDLGRPERMFNMILYYTERVHTSPLMWDITVVLIYFAFSVTYLLMTMRADLAAIHHESKIKKMIYDILLFGYKPSENEKTEQMAWWLALALIALMALLSGGVVPWLFGMMRAQPGYFGAVLGPYFLIAALASATAAVILLSAVVRHVYKWHKTMPIDIFKGLSKALAILMVLYLWFILHEAITAQWGADTQEMLVSSSLLYGEFAPYFWFVVLGLIGSIAYLAYQAVKPEKFNLNITVGISTFVILLFWIKRFLIVTPPLYYNTLPYPTGTYAPTMIEWFVVAGTIALTILGIMLFLKFFPPIELDVLEDQHKETEV